MARLAIKIIYLDMTSAAELRSAVNTNGRRLDSWLNRWKASKVIIGKSETAADVVTASTMVKFAATLGLENPPLEKGSAIPPGWYGGLFPASHRPDKMRTDGQASGGGFMPAIPLPRRRIGGTRVAFHEPLRIGDDVTRKTEIADLTGRRRSERRPSNDHRT